MAQNEASESKRVFSEFYIQKGQPIADSERFRRRLQSYLEANLKDEGTLNFKLFSLLRQETGAEIKNSGSYAYSIAWFFAYASMRDLLDAITYVWNVLARDDHVNRKSGGYGLSTDKAKKWRQFVARALREENLSYSIDEDGVVHYFLDAEFERTRLAAVAFLHLPRYSAVRLEFDEAYKSLDATPPDTKEAIRRIFEANETAYKLLVKAEGKARLNARAVLDAIGPRAEKWLAPNVTAINSVKEHTKSFAAWVEAAHWYRHGQGEESPKPPPMEYTVTMLSQGAAFLRWLLILDLATPQM